MKTTPHKNQTKSIGRFVAGIWLANALCIISLGVGWLVYQPDQKNNDPVITAISQTPVFTATVARQASATANSTNPQPAMPGPATSQTETATAVPFSAGPISIGYSVSQKPIQVYRFGTGQIERLIVAGMHGGDEQNTTALADELIAHINDHPESVPADITLYILRNLNPDGEARGTGAAGRANDNGVDLNRNWPAFWQEKPAKDCWYNPPLSAGASPASEPETIALMYFIKYHRFDALINYHSAALGIFPGGRPPDPASASLAEALAEISTYPYPPIDSGCSYDGTLVDWASLQGIAAVDIELSNHQDTDFEQNLKILSIFLSWKR